MDMYSSLPFALAQVEYGRLSTDIRDFANSASEVPENFQGRVAATFAEKQMSRQAALSQLAESATEASSISATQNVADETLKQAPSPQDLKIAAAALDAARAQMRAGNVAPAQLAEAEQEYMDMKRRREAALDAHAGESAATTGCLGGLVFPDVQPRGGDIPEPPKPPGTEIPDDRGNLPGEKFNPKNPSDEDPPTPPGTSGDPPPDDVVSPGPSASTPPGGGGGSGGGSGGGGALGMDPLDPMGPMSPLTPAESAGTGLSVGGAPMMPQQPAMQPMMQQPPGGGGMPGMGGMPMPGGIPMPGTGFTAPPSGRQLDPMPKNRNQDSGTTKEDLDMTLFPGIADGVPAAAGAAVAGAGVGAAVAGAVTAANVTGITPPVVSAMPPGNPIGGGTPGGPYGGGAYGGGMAPMGSGAGMAGGGNMVKREPILASDVDAGQENLLAAVDAGTIGRSTAEPPTSGNR